MTLLISFYFQLWACLDLYYIGFCDCLAWKLCHLLNEQQRQPKYHMDIWCQLCKCRSRLHLWICTHSSAGILLFASVLGCKCQPRTLLVLVGIFPFHFRLDFCKYVFSHSPPFFGVQFLTIVYIPIILFAALQNSFKFLASTNAKQKKSVNANVLLTCNCSNSLVTWSISFLFSPILSLFFTWGMPFEPHFLMKMDLIEYLDRFHHENGIICF